ncbi:hypothetical protein WAI453_012820 [Rhynchosporium graminicola]
MLRVEVPREAVDIREAVEEAEGVLKNVISMPTIQRGKTPILNTPLKKTK